MTQVTEITRQEELLALAGRMSDIGRRLVGGRDLNGAEVAPANLANVGALADMFRKALDSYDRLILENSK